MCFVLCPCLSRKRRGRAHIDLEEGLPSDEGEPSTAAAEKGGKKGRKAFKSKAFVSSSESSEEEQEKLKSSEDEGGLADDGDGKGTAGEGEESDRGEEGSSGSASSESESEEERYESVHGKGSADLKVQHTCVTGTGSFILKTIINGGCDGTGLFMLTNPFM